MVDDSRGGRPPTSRTEDDVEFDFDCVAVFALDDSIESSCLLIAHTTVLLIS